MRNTNIVSYYLHNFSVYKCMDWWNWITIHLKRRAWAPSSHGNRIISSNNQLWQSDLPYSSTVHQIRKISQEIRKWKFNLYPMVTQKLEGTIHFWQSYVFGRRKWSSPLPHLESEKSDLVWKYIISFLSWSSESKGDLSMLCNAHNIYFYIHY